jgi:hypothetical protein
MRRILLASCLALAAVLPIASFGVTSVLAASSSSQSAHLDSLAAGATHCPNYQNGPNCIVVPPSGLVNVTICGIHFVGTAAPGTTIECSFLPLLIHLPCSSSATSVGLPQTGGAATEAADSRLSRQLHLAAKTATTCCETGTSVSIHGTDLNLKVPGAKIYKFNPATGTSTLVKAVLGSGGEYTFVFGSCPGGLASTVPLPKTGGGEASSLAAAAVPGPAGAPGVPVLPIGAATLLAMAGIGAFVVFRSRVAHA